MLAKIDKIKSLIILFVIVNAVLAVFFISALFLMRISEISFTELQEIYPRFYKLIFWLADEVSCIFIALFILFFLANGILILILAKRFNKIREIILFSVVMILVLVLVEIGLRVFAGYRPGTHTNVIYFTYVDSLYKLESFESDSNGVFKVSKVAIEQITDHIKRNDTALKKHQSLEVYSLIQETIDLRERELKNEFADLYYALSSMDTSVLSEHEKAILQFATNPLNEDGFRSIPFKSYTNSKPRILLIGDSFTWGHSASVKSASFSDIMLARGYTVYNAGISGTDVAQYLAVAKKYIPLLKPDVVIVNFFLGNDITYYKREVKPYAPVFYPTNAGNLMACPHGTYFENADEAYAFNYQLYNIPQDENLFNKAMAKTVITTLTWRIFLRMGLVNYGSVVKNYFAENKKIKYSKPYCNTQLKEIKTIAEKYNSRFILSSIPEVYRFTFNTKKNFPDLFDGLDFVEMQVGKEDYKLDDGHFNDLGHKRYADFLIQQIQSNE